jgi:hypothetical protein
MENALLGSPGGHSAGPVTPRLTCHARQRCTEMGLKTKDVKRAFRHGLIDYPGPPEHGRGLRMRLSSDGSLAIAYAPSTRPVILTVLWHGIEFERPPA